MSKPLMFGQSQLHLIIGRRVFLGKATDAQEYLDSTPATEGMFEPKELADLIAAFLDEEAENANYHHLCGAYFTILSDLRAAGADEDVVRKFMLQLLGRGGLYQ